jgi:uroporphyrin-III C-methyltransferase / precorrin-2 dehydrogenase / sirohydrochlorin ferrochelatase
MRSLPLFHRISGQPVIVLGDGAIAEPKRRLVERAGGYVIGDLQEGIDKGARLAFVAYEDDQAAQIAAIRLRCAGLLVNVVDRPDLCDFTTPSLLDRDPVLIAIGTSGASAGLAKQLRLRLETLLPQTLGALAERLYGARSVLRTLFPDTGGRRRALDDALGEGGALDPFDGGSADRVAGWLGDPRRSAGGRRVAITLTSDDPDDLTLRQARLLGSADAILFEPAVPAAILDRARADAMRAELPWNGPDPDGLVVLLQHR